MEWISECARRLSRVWEGENVEYYHKARRFLFLTKLTPKLGLIDFAFILWFELSSM